MSNATAKAVPKQRPGSRGVWLRELAREQVELQLALVLVNAGASIGALDPALIDDATIGDLADLIASHPHLAREASIVDVACFVHAEPELIAFIEWLSLAPRSFLDSVRPLSVLVTALNMRGMISLCGSEFGGCIAGLSA